MSLVQKTQATIAEQFSIYGIDKTAKVAVAVSGGADSMALALLCSELRNITALTVDHGLRPDSADEAKWVNAELNRHNISCHILTCKWQEVPTSNVQAAAREQRYQLMAGWCAENQISYLLTAHHMEDQAETLMLRLARGSGAYGLAAMPEKRALADTVTLVRPLLGTSKQDLRDCLAELGQFWIDDPSNRNEAFDRVKIREFMAKPPLEGFSAERLSETAKRMQRTRAALEYYERQWLSGLNWNAATCHAEFLKDHLAGAPEDIVLRGMKTAIQCIGGADHGVRFEKLERLLADMRSESFAGATLGGARFIAQANNRIMIVREQSAVEGNVRLSQESVWDNRFSIVGQEASTSLDAEVGALGERGLTRLIQLDADIVGDKVLPLPKAALLSVAAIWHDGALVAIPTLDVSLDGGKWSNVLRPKRRLMEN